MRELLPSLGANLAFELRGPAAYGDVARAVIDGATAIGIVDGRFEDTRAVWHKEILFALSEGVAVAGAASMGALRAAECAAFGMIGIGDVYRRYVSGEFDDDGDVAQLHGPAELGFLALSEPLANIVATLEALEAESLISAGGIFPHSISRRAGSTTRSAAIGDCSKPRIFRRIGRLS